ncbi:hypothetical protein SISNIDRAFT_465219 [Sistotremastrum niveocremeum HHB9708]|uniref:Uncharacterized protein n=1 Tax=Sistotremastrum niveocremeum HHB9708 TaxID=1314777 RepID=A0A164WEL2_9AGAM|nr:hypothetical protein SISNIDRAFT_465219 [Sistotremastrum niveocremeum HHB9708]
MVFSPPVGAPTDSPAAIVAKREVTMRARLKNWFINHTRDTGSRSGGGKLNLLQPRPRRPRATNAYATLFGEERGLDALISKAYAEYCAGEGASLPQRALTHREATLRKLYAQETQEVKDAVEAYRNRPPTSPWLHDLPDDASEDERETAKLAYYARNQRALPGACYSALFCMSGVDLRTGGKIATSWYDAGVTHAERGHRSQSIPEMYPEMMDDLVTKVSRHSQKVTTPIMRAEIRRLLAAMDIDGDGDENSEDDNEDDGSDDERPAKSARKSGPKSSQGKKSGSVSKFRPAKSKSATSLTTSTTPTTAPTTAKGHFGPASAEKTDHLSSEPDPGAEFGEEIRWWRWHDDPKLPEGYKNWEGIHAAKWLINLVVHRSCTKALLRSLYMKQLAALRAAGVTKIADLPADQAWSDDLNASVPTPFQFVSQSSAPAPQPSIETSKSAPTNTGASPASSDANQPHSPSITPPTNSTVPPHDTQPPQFTSPHVADPANAIPQQGTQVSTPPNQDAPPSAPVPSGGPAPTENSGPTNPVPPTLTNLPASHGAGLDNAPTSPPTDNSGPTGPVPSIFANTPAANRDGSEDVSTPPSNNLVITPSRPSNPSPLSQASGLEADEPHRTGGKKRKAPQKKGQTAGEPASKKTKSLPKPKPRWNGKENVEPPRDDDGEGEGEGDSVGQRKMRVRQRTARGEAAIQALTGRRRKSVNSCAGKRLGVAAHRIPSHIIFDDDTHLTCLATSIIDETDPLSAYP